MKNSRPTLLCVAAIAGSSAAQTVTFQQIVGPDDAIRSHGFSPALSGDAVAFLGNDKGTSDSGIYLTSVDGTAPFTLVVDENTPAPNVPGETLRFLDNPELHDGVVVFTAGHQLSSTINDGIYLGSGGPLTVWFDHWNDLLGTPNPAEPFRDESGMLFRSAGANSSDYLQWSFPYFSTQPSSASILGTSPLPGGGSMIKTTEIGESVSMGGGTVVFSARVNYPGGVDGGCYTWDPSTGAYDLVANWTTPMMPGTAMLFEYFGEVDTDGSRVVFSGSSGFVGFGGHKGIYTAPVGSGENGPVEIVAEVGGLAPDGAEFSSFGRVAVDGDLVVFEGFVSGGVGLFGSFGDGVFEILDTDDQLDGVDINDVDFHPRGLDGNRLAVRVLYPHHRRRAVPLRALRRDDRGHRLPGGPRFRGTGRAGADPLRRAARLR